MQKKSREVIHLTTQHLQPRPLLSCHESITRKLLPANTVPRLQTNHCVGTMAKKLHISGLLSRLRSKDSHSSKSIHNPQQALQDPQCGEVKQPLGCQNKDLIFDFENSPKHSRRLKADPIRSSADRFSPKNRTKNPHLPLLNLSRIAAEDQNSSGNSLRNCSPVVCSPILNQKIALKSTKKWFYNSSFIPIKDRHRSRHGELESCSKLQSLAHNSISESSPARNRGSFKIHRLESSSNIQFASKEEKGFSPRSHFSRMKKQPAKEKPQPSKLEGFSHYLRKVLDGEESLRSCPSRDSLKIGELS